jgi:hypothetical protein
MKCNNKIKNTFNSNDDWMNLFIKKRRPKYVIYQIQNNYTYFVLKNVDDKNVIVCKIDK